MKSEIAHYLDVPLIVNALLIHLAWAEQMKRNYECGNRESVMLMTAADTKGENWGRARADWGCTGYGLSALALRSDRTDLFPQHLEGFFHYLDTLQLIMSPDKVAMLGRLEIGTNGFDDG